MEGIWINEWPIATKNMIFIKKIKSKISYREMQLESFDNFDLSLTLCFSVVKCLTSAVQLQLAGGMLAPRTNRLANYGLLRSLNLLNGDQRRGRPLPSPPSPPGSPCFVINGSTTRGAPSGPQMSRMRARLSPMPSKSKVDLVGLGQKGETTRQSSRLSRSAILSVSGR